MVEHRLESLYMYHGDQSPKQQTLEKIYPGLRRTLCCEIGCSRFSWRDQGGFRFCPVSFAAAAVCLTETVLLLTFSQYGLDESAFYLNGFQCLRIVLLWKHLLIKTTPVYTNAAVWEEEFTPLSCCFSMHFDVLEASLSLPEFVFLFCCNKQSENEREMKA